MARKKGAKAREPTKGKKKIQPKDIPRTQRKIFHVLDSEGSGDSFAYSKQLNPAISFTLGQEVYLTEKWDGTTVQATNQGIFKRIDKLKKGDTKKFKATEEQRYDIKEIDLDDKSNKHIAKAVAAHLESFNGLEDGYCVYFEALGPSIGSRFKHIPDFFDIRVFDFSLKGEFLSFEQTIELAETHNLPLTAYQSCTLDIDRIIQLLDSPTCYEDVDAQLEGFVIRASGFELEDGGSIAKFRVDDIMKIKSE